MEKLRNLIWTLIFVLQADFFVDTNEVKNNSSVSSNRTGICKENDECYQYLACINETCADPCTNACVQNSVCSVISHEPRCACLEGYAGDPFVKCTPYTPFTAQVNITIIFAPVVINKSSSSEVKAILKSSAFLKCKASGFPKPKITWRFTKYKKNIEKSNTKYKLNDNILEITNITEDDLGAYLCIAKNENSVRTRGYKLLLSSKTMLTFPSMYQADVISYDEKTNVTEKFQVYRDNGSILKIINESIKECAMEKWERLLGFSTFPVTTEHTKNKIYCIQKGYYDTSLTINVLPESIEVQSCGEEHINGKIAKKWCQEGEHQMVIFTENQISKRNSSMEIQVPVKIIKQSEFYNFSIEFLSFKDEPFNMTLYIRKMFTTFDEKKKKKNGLTCYFMHEIKREIDAEALPNQEEFRKHHPPRPFYLDTTHYKNLPEQFNWKDHGGLNEVKDQGSYLYSGWSFTAIAAIEFAYYKGNGWKTLPKLSAQALIDCSWGFRNKGTFGGKAEWAFDWAIKHADIPLEEDYPYVARNDYCTIENKRTLDVRVDSWGRVYAWEDYDRVTVIKAAIVNYGPLAIEMHSSLESFKSYKGGTYNDTECESRSMFADHAALLVGYGRGEHGTEYWIIKNSYGKKWGINGYAHIAIEGNICGVVNNPLFVTVSNWHQIL